MGKLTIKRLIQAIPMLIVISIVSFSLIKLAPGDPVQSFITPAMSDNDILRIRQNLGLDRPVYIQYIQWLKNVITGNLGYSLINHRPVLNQILERIPATLGLMGSSLLLSILVGIPLGLISAANKNKWIDNISAIFSYVGISIPSFWFAMILIYTFSLKLNLLPSIGMRTVGIDTTWDLIKHGIMPTIVLSLQNIAVITRYIRSSTISQLKEDYVMVEYASGASKAEVLYKYVLKNSILPVITIVGMSLPSLVSGAFITETVFGWPGMGQLGINSIFSFDYPVIMAITMFSSLLLIIGNLLSDILYGIADPRIKELR
ncbi:ABC transporter permease [Alkaliphilus sp. B6464]|uniref:ABC transporter permease n=1 Tax=Alkaliphilus sp. B6464 TaxID=2731219 RepID=UPI001BEE6987|nr:ABC transporter permease [Alkaliphilus sp. B6464]